VRRALAISRPLRSIGDATYVIEADSTLRRNDWHPARVTTIARLTNGPLPVRQADGAVFADHTLYVADASRHDVVSIDLRTGNATLVAGRPDVRGTDDGDALSATFDHTHSSRLLQTVEFSSRTRAPTPFAQLISRSTAFRRWRRTLGVCGEITFGPDHRLMRPQANENTVAVFDEVGPAHSRPS